MDYYSGMRAFARVVELGSFSKAADELGIKVSTVSRYVTALEQDLGAALLNRSTRRLRLTEVGTLFYERSARILIDVEDARAEARDLNQRPQGLLKVTTPGAFGRHHVMPHLPTFLATFPDIRVDVTLSDARIDLIDAGLDVAIRIGALGDSTLIAQRLAYQRRLLVVRPDRIRSEQLPKTPSDLAGLDCLTFGTSGDAAWYCLPDNAPIANAQAIPVSGPLRANDSDALLAAAFDGLGIALLPSWLVGRHVAEGRLLRLLPEWTWTVAPGPEPAIWGIYPPKKTVSPKVRAFLDFMRKAFGDPAYWDR